MKKIFSLINQYSLRYTSINTSSNSEDSRISLLLDKIPTALNYASFSLFNQLQKIDSLSMDETRKINSSLRKYCARAKYRVVPYGLFSTVMKGVFSDESLFNIQKSMEKADLQISNDWLNKARQAFEKEAYTIKKVSVKRNIFVRIRHNYIFIFKQAIQKENEEIIKIRKTSLLTFILGCVNTQFYKVSDLVELCLSNFPSLSEQELLEYIVHLVTLELLVTDIFFSVETAQKKLKKLETVAGSPTKEIIGEIINLQKEFNLHNSYDTREKNKLLSNINSLQMSVCTAKKYVYLNSVSYEIYNLSLKDKANIFEFGNIISLFLKKIRDNKLDFYKDYINQLSDTYAPVHIIDILINTYSSPDKTNNVQQSFQIGSLGMLQERINQALLDNAEVIILNDMDIKKLHDEAFEKDFFQSIDEFEMLISIVTNEKGENIYIYNNGSITNSVGSYIGRFRHIFPEKEFTKNNILELIQLPEVADAADVIHSGKSKYQTLNLENRESSVNLDDLYVTMTNGGKLCLIDKNMQSYLPRQTCMINPSLCYSRLYNLLFNLQFEYKENITDVFNDLKYQYHFMPRVTYKNFVLVKRHWKIYYPSLMHLKKNPGQFKEYLIGIGCPVLVGVVTPSATTYYNLLEEERVADLFNELKLKGYLLLTESLWEFGNPITDNLNNEFVFSFKTKEEESDTNFFDKKSISSQFESPNFEKEWITVKAYIDYEFHNDFLHDLSKIWEIHKPYGSDTHFFIRYEDPQPHFRLRFKMMDEDAMYIFLKEIMQFLKNIKYINNVSTEWFKPEYHRYGGIKLAHKCLGFFCWESNVFNGRYTEVNFLQIVAHIYSYLERYGLSMQDIKLYTTRYKNADKFPFLIHDRINTFNQIDGERQKLENEYYTNMELNKVNIELNKTPDNIIDALVHMSINRLNGIDHSAELKILRLLYDYSAFSFYREKK